MTLKRLLPVKEFGYLKKLMGAQGMIAGDHPLLNEGAYGWLAGLSSENIRRGRCTAANAGCRACGEPLARGSEVLRIPFFPVESTDRYTNGRRRVEILAEGLVHFPLCAGRKPPVGLPGVHLTARAYEWLTRSTQWYGGFKYTSEPGLLACPSPLLEHRYTGGQVCGVEDVRAMLLKQQTKLMWRSGTSFSNRRPIEEQLRVAVLHAPTCLNCLLILDHALTLAPAKHGRYAEAHPSHRDPRQWALRWVTPSTAKAERVMTELKAERCTAGECDGAALPTRTLCGYHFKRVVRSGSPSLIQNGSRAEADRGSPT